MFRIAILDHDLNAIHLAIQNYETKQSGCADINAFDENGRTFLHLANNQCIKYFPSFPPIIKVLLEKMEAGIVNLQDNNGCTALHYAADVDFSFRHLKLRILMDTIIMIILGIVAAMMFK